MPDASKTITEELAIEEVVDYALTYLDYPLAALSPDGAGSPDCGMGPGEFELARATVAYMAYRLLLMDRMGGGGAGGGVAMARFSSEVRQDIASALGIVGPSGAREDEVRRLYKVAGAAWDADGAYRDRVASVMQDLEERHGLDAGALGIVFV